jgi:leader peptidase (prepilin peptidase) / N-methyltransferase
VWTAIMCGIVGAMIGPFIVRWAYQLIERRPHAFLPSPALRRFHYAMVAIFAATALTAVGIRWDGSQAAPAFSWFAATGIALVAVDIDFHRLPHHLVGAMALGGGALLGIADPDGLLRGLVAAMVVAGCWSLARVLLREGVGPGDVTLSGAIALYLGWMGWRYLLLTVVMSAVLAGTFAAFLLATRRAGPTDQFAYGPALVFCTLLVLVVP